MSTTTQAPKPKRRSLRFSLRALLIVMTLFVVGVACVKIVHDLLGMIVLIESID